MTSRELVLTLGVIKLSDDLVIVLGCYVTRRCGSLESC